MVQKTNKTKSRLGREFNGEYIDAPMGEDKTELLDSLVKKAKKKIKYVHEVGDKVEGLGEPRNLEIAEKCVSEGKADIFDRPEIKMGWEELRQHSEKGDRERSFLEEHNRLHALHKDLLINEQLLKTDKENEKKAKFFRRLNKVLDKKLVKPSIIIEYVNQYQRGDK